MEFSSRFEDFLACSMDLNTKNPICKFIGSFCIKRSIMKHLEYFNLKNVFSGFCYGPDSVNIFFFSIVGFDFFFPRNWFYLMYPSLKFSIKKKISIKKKECKKENGNNNE